MAADPASSNVILYGTDEAPAPIRRFALGPLAFDLEAGKLLLETYNADRYVLRVQGQSKHPAIEPERIVSPSVLVAEIVQGLQPYRPLAAGASPYLLVTDTVTDQSQGTLRLIARA